MTMIARNGSETGVLADEWHVVTGTPTANTSSPITGIYDALISGNIAAGSVESVAMTFANLATGYYQVKFKINSLDTTDGTLYVQLLDSTVTNFAFVFQVVYDGADLIPVCFINDFGVEIVLSGYTLTVGAEHTLEFYYNSADAGATDDVEIKLDGVTIGSSGSETLATTPAYMECGIFNAGVGTISGSSVQFDDLCINSSAGSTNNSWPNLEEMRFAVPTGAGDNAATAGTAASVNEIPWTDTATSSADRIELDTNATIADFAMTDTATLGINSYDVITGVSVMVRLREEAAAATGYNLRVKSASGGAVAASSTVDAGNATVRTNPSGTTNFGRYHFVEVDPTTGVAFTPTGTNSVDSMQAGIASTTANDIWGTAFGAYVCYRRGVAPTALTGIIGGTGVIPS